MIKATNKNIMLSVCFKHPESRYSHLVGYEEGDTDINGDKLKLFEENPQIANEFITDMSNMITAQYAYDLFRDFKNPYDMFIKTMSKLGDAEQYITNVLKELVDYAEGTSPFSATKPTIKTDFIKTIAKKVANVKLEQDVWAGAFVSEGGLANIAGIVLKNLSDSITLFVYDSMTTLTGDATAFPITTTVTTVSGVGQTQSARDAYEQIMALANKMHLPNTLYNASHVKTFTPKGNLVLFLNADYKASFDINVLASLFNSPSVGLDKFFKEVCVVDMPSSQAKQIGIVLDSESMVWGFRLKTAGSIYNPADMSINYWLHAWIKWGVIPARQAIRLVHA